MAKKVLGENEAKELLHQENTGRLGTYNGTYPYIIPLCYIYHNDSIYFHCGPKGQKMDHIRQNPRVCFQVDRVSGIRQSSSPCSFNVDYQSVIVYGTAREISCPKEKAEVLGALAVRFAGGNRLDPIPQSKVDITNVVKIEIEAITGKANEK